MKNNNQKKLKISAARTNLLDAQASSGRLLKQFNAGLAADKRIADLKTRVEAFGASYPMPGFVIDASKAATNGH